MEQEAGWWSFSSLMLATAIVIGVPATGWGHGVVGKRFFPTTVTIEDPFVADELTFVVDHIKGPEEKETELELEIQKRLSPDLAIGFGGSYRIIKPSGGHDEHGEPSGTVSGFSNPTFSLRYQFLRNSVRELVGTLALDIEAGGIGAKQVEALSGTTLTPAFQIGKGFGDLPEWADWLKPVALTGSFGINLLLSHRGETEEAQNSLAWGTTIMYSIPYLQSFVKDVGIRWPLSRLIPIVEFSGEMLLTGEKSGDTTTFVNPGLIWTGRYFQLAVEAQIPLNDVSGRNVGIMGMIHLFLDDIAPRLFTWTPFHGVLGPQR